MSPTDQPQPGTEAQPSRQLASELKARRASFGGRVEDMARDSVVFGQPDTSPADAWAVDEAHGAAGVALLYSERTPVELSDGYVGVGRERVPLYSLHIDDVLGAYVQLVRKLRGGANAPIVGFRRVDIDAIAVHFGWSGAHVVGQLAVAVGASKPRAQSMLKSYELGSATINTGCSTAGESKPDEPGVPSRLHKMLIDP